MSLFGKPRVSEVRIAGEFVISTLQGVQAAWPELRTELQAVSQNVPEPLDDKFAPFEFGLAVISVQLQALPNVLPPDQGRRIRSYAVQCLCSDELGTYPAEALEEYQAAWDSALQAAEPPFGAVASVLYDKLGFSAQVTVGDASFKDPILLTAMGALVTTFGGPFWKNAAANYRIVV